MPPKKTPTPTVQPDVRSEHSPSAEEPTIAEYNELVAAHKEALRRIEQLEANVESSQTSLGPQERLRNPKVEPPPEFSGKIAEFPNFMAACSLVFTLCPNTYSSHERKSTLCH